MKRIFTIILLFFLSEIGSFAQEQTEKIRKNSVSVDYGLLAGKNKNEYSSAVNIFYRRNLWKGLGVGVCYQFYNYSFLYNGDWTINTKPPLAEIKSHSALARVDYEFIFLRHVSLLPFVQIGTDWKQYKNETIFVGRYGNTFEVWSAKDNAFVYSGGLQLGAKFSAVAVYLQYEYCVPKIKISENNFDKIDDNSLKHFKLGLGARYAF
ncbi:MAG: hypothetical protein II926_07255 [Bacteroidales bacterium]|nr:hypothetical protein [Bacteroidales bacterium]